MPAISQAITKWREVHQFRDEFHFTRIRENNLLAYLTVLDLLDRYAATVSFRAIVIERRGHKDIQRVLDDMLKHLIIRGVTHGQETGRAPLPRSISVFKDAEEAVRDQLAVANLTTDLKHAPQASFDGRLYVSLVQAVDSKQLVPFQTGGPPFWLSGSALQPNSTSSGERCGSSERPVCRCLPCPIQYLGRSKRRTRRRYDGD